MSRSASAAEAAPVSDDQAATLFASLLSQSKLLLAVSGGPDSTALLWLVAKWRARQPSGPALTAATVDHRLRPGSDVEARGVGALAERLGVPHAILAWSGDKPTSGIEAAARTARYELLFAHARHVGAEAVVLAHTLDEQAETVLMRLAAGSGPAGLAAMRPAEMVEGIGLLRPFLEVAKARLIATLRRDEVPYDEDPMNIDPRFARPRLRAAREALAQEGLTATRLARLARRMARVEEVVAEAAASLRREALIAGPPARFVGALLAGAPEELALRVLSWEVAAVATEHPEGVPPVRLQRLELLWADLRAALGAGRGLRRTLAGALISVNPDGTVTIARAPPRRHNVSVQSGKTPGTAPGRPSAAKTFTRTDVV